jgi:hypothetical protein
VVVAEAGRPNLQEQEEDFQRRGQGIEEDETTQKVHERRGCSQRSNNIFFLFEIVNFELRNTVPPGKL